MARLVTLKLLSLVTPVTLILQPVDRLCTCDPVLPIAVPLLEPTAKLRAGVSVAVRRDGDRRGRARAADRRNDLLALNGRQRARRYRGVAAQCVGEAGRVYERDRRVRDVIDRRARPADRDEVARA